MILWFVGSLFTYGYITGKDEGETFWESVSIFFIAMFLWPLFLGFAISQPDFFKNKTEEDDGSISE